jgi:hypothetical protein
MSKNAIAPYSFSDRKGVSFLGLGCITPALETKPDLVWFPNLRGADTRMGSAMDTEIGQYMGMTRIWTWKKRREILYL